jgi:predicted lipid-binding transport protein (Tim44 family)
MSETLHRERRRPDQASTATHWTETMPITCPHCGETKKRAKLPQPARDSLRMEVMGGFIGGCIGGLFCALSQESKFQCGQCGQMFFSHTTVSRVFWVLCLFMCGLLAFGICYAIWTASHSPP